MGKSAPPSRRALCIAVTYAGDRTRWLPDTATDVNNIASLLLANEYAVTVMCDAPSLVREPFCIRPTAFKIREELRLLTQWLNREPGRQGWFHYSGHGWQAPNDDGNESDGLDELLVPCDWRRSGYISDDELSALVATLRPEAELMVVMDCCHSGTMLDLPFTTKPSGAVVASNAPCFPAPRDSASDADG
eukprot:2427739-Pleurochrysis_carterae.AAC.1